MGVLKQLSTAEAIWAQQDIDGNKTKDFWTYDVSCLHRMYRADGASKCAFIPLQMAQADARPAGMEEGDNPFGETPAIAPLENPGNPTAYFGYFIRAMLVDEEENEYNQNPVGANNILATNTDRYAFVHIRLYTVQPDTGHLSSMSQAPSTQMTAAVTKIKLYSNGPAKIQWR